MSAVVRHVARSLLAASLLAASLLASAPARVTLEAQQRRTSPARTPAAGRGETAVPRTRERQAASVRAEYAAVLLQAKRYREAAREYRALLTRDSTNASYRLGLVHALAWGGRYPEAERELRPLVRRRPTDAALDSLLRVVRASYAPRAADATEWVREQPAYAPYRLALARALVRERRAAASLAHFDTLLARAPTGELWREAARAYARAGDRAGGVALVRAAVARAPDDTAARRAYADVLAGDRRLAEAVAQYDTLIATHPSSDLLTQRAKFRAWHRDYAGAEADLRTSIALAPTLEAQLLLGDLARARGDYGAARASYLDARALAGPDSGQGKVSAALGRLARDERPPAAFIPWPPAPGAELTTFAISDNAGFSYSAVGVRHGFPIPLGVLATIGLERRELGGTVPGASRALAGWNAQAGVSKVFAHGAISGRSGVLVHPGAGTIASAAITGTAWLAAWQLSMTAASDPAYPMLLSLESLLPKQGSELEPLVADYVSLALAGPIRLADVALRLETMELSDGNSRSNVQGSARYPLRPALWAVYTGGTTGFAERSGRYWDPIRYVAHAAGIEYASRRPRGLSFAARALPGIASTVESSRDVFNGVRGDPMRRRAFQFVVSADAAYRSERWELSAAGGYGRGRDGGYESGYGTLVLRVTP